jgi:ribosome biogenesis GTPase
LSKNTIENDATSSPSGQFEGLVVDGSRGLYFVATDVGRIACTIRGRLRKELEYASGSSQRKRVQVAKVKVHDPVAVGDRVRLLRTGESTGVIEEVMAREGGAFTRSDPNPSAGSLTTVAGLDQMIIVFAVREPEPHLGLLDRFLVIAEAQEMEAVICLSKVDLGLSAQLEGRLLVYQKAGYPVIMTSTSTGQGMAELRACVEGRTSAFLGKSGVGKSSLLQALEPELEVRVGQVSLVTGKGRHTTTSTRLFPLSGPAGGYIADTAGIRALGLDSDTRRQLDWCFPEFRPYLGKCRLANCIHVHEPDCAIREHVEDGVIDGQRYLSYCHLRGDESAPEPSQPLPAAIDLA